MPGVNNAPGGNGSDIGAVEYDVAQSGAPQNGVNFLVNSSRDRSDGVCGLGDCTLREAIEEANADPSSSVISFSVGNDYSLDQALPELTGVLEIRGLGANRIGINRGGAAKFRIFSVAPNANVTLSGLEIARGDVGGLQGNSPPPLGTPPSNSGAGVLNRGRLLVVAGCQFSFNVASSDPSNSNGNGGGLYSEGNLTVKDSTFFSNRAGLGGGIYSVGAALVTNSTFAANAANFGGGFYGAGATIANSRLLPATLRPAPAPTTRVRAFTLRGLTMRRSPSPTPLSLATAPTGTWARVTWRPASAPTATTSSAALMSAVLARPMCARPIPNSVILCLETAASPPISCPSPTAPAVNAGDPNFNGTGAFDQRGPGFPRVVGGRLDIGAIESPYGAGGSNSAPSVSNFVVRLNAGTTFRFAPDSFDGAFSDPEGAQLSSITIVSLPTSGSLFFLNQAVSTTRIIGRNQLDSLTFTPGPEFSGTTSFNYNASDGALLTASSATVTLTTNPAPPNTPPTIRTSPTARYRPARRPGRSPLPSAMPKARPPI